MTTSPFPPFTKADLESFFAEPVGADYIAAEDPLVGPGKGEFTTKPNVVEAVQWRPGMGPNQLPSWLLRFIDVGVVDVTIQGDGTVKLNVEANGDAPEADVNLTDWLVLDRGDLYVYENHLFRGDFEFRKWTDDALWQRFCQAAALADMNVSPDLRPRAIKLLREAEREGANLDGKIHVEWTARGIKVSGE